jgi:hypothetical protein
MLGIAEQVMNGLASSGEKHIGFHGLAPFFDGRFFCIDRRTGLNGLLAAKTGVILGNERRRLPQQTSQQNQ